MNHPLPSILETKLAEFRRRVWVVKLAEGALAALCGILLSYLFVFVLDRFIETPGWLRLALLAAGGATLGIGLPLKWHRWVWRQRGLEDAARLLRHKFPRLGDQLLGLVELARMDHAAAGRSERLVEAAMAQAAEAVKDRDFRHAVPHARHRQWGWAAAGAVAVIVVAFALVNEAAGNALARWIAPWKKIERFTFAKIQPLPDKLVVPYAESFALPVRLAANTLRSPESSVGHILGQPPVEAKLSDGVYPLSFPPQKSDAPLALALGDVRKSIQVEPRPRPELAELAVRMHLPAYLGYSEQRLEVRGGGIDILKGTEASFEAKASRALAAADIDGQPQRVEGELIATAYEPVTADSERKINWRARDGLTPRDPFLLRVRAVNDEPPKIVARRESLEQVVLDSEVVTFDVSATDDFGVKRVGLDWVGAADAKGTALRGEKISAAGGNETKGVEARATFCATREGVAPQTLEVRAWAEDYLPGRTRSHSAAFVLHVLNKTDHALWLTEQFGKWLEAAKESYEREQQLHETNKELRAMDPAELDRPENRRRVAQQATGENANAARLDGLTQSGRNLVEQATKNDEFDAKRLESWATMLQSLKDIAANRMPSVADLLKKTANASVGKPGGAPNANPASQTQSQTQTPPSSNLAQQGQRPSNSQSAPNVSHGENPPPSQNPPPPIDPNAPPKPAAPTIADREGGFPNKPTEPPPVDPNAKPKAPGASKLGLPNTMLGAAPAKKDDGAKPPETPAQETMTTAITEQKDLLAEFAKVSDQLSEILSSLEGSTFVKRFKAASRQQMSIASTINQKTLSAFGIEHQAVSEAEDISKRAKEQSEVVHVIQNDLEAYFQRKQDSHFKLILDEMKKTEVVRALARDGDRASDNLSGQSLMGSEYWADVLDRWAEDLVAACNCKCNSKCSPDSLPPEIVLKVMQSLRDEMKLRDETREMGSARPALIVKEYVDAAKALATTQDGIKTRTKSAADDILALPNADKFGKELKLLAAVDEVMGEATQILQSPETGAPAIAAETEAIELLLQAKRPGNKPGGGGGSNPGGGGRAAFATSAALADLGPGSDAKSFVSTRPVGQATGHAGKEFPAEFKAGLDSYFNLLETPATPR